MSMPFSNGSAGNPDGKEAVQPSAKKCGVLIARRLCVAAGLLLFCPGFVGARGPELSLRNRFALSVDIDTQTGMYFVRYKGQLWLGRGFVSVLAQNRWYRSSQVKFPGYGGYERQPGMLVLDDAKRDSGDNPLFVREDNSPLGVHVPVNGKCLHIRISKTQQACGF